MAVDTSQPLRHPEIVGLGRSLFERRQEVVEGMVERIRTEIEFYRSGAVSLDDLWASCDRNFEMILRPLINPSPVDLRPPRETGRRRARQRAPLPEVMAAYRVGFRFVWETLVAEAQQRGRTSSGALVAAASALWVSHDEYTDAMAIAYRETLTADLRHDERERTAMVEALLDGDVSGGSSIWEVAELLRLPAGSAYAVVAAEVPDIAREALPGVEAKLGRKDIASAWKLRPEMQVGIAALKTPAKLDALVAVLQEMGPARVGVSPTYTALEQTATALRLARLALAASRPGSVTRFDAAPVPVTVACAADVMPRVASAILGPLLEVRPDDRDILLETLEAWRDNGGSATAAGAKLFCHPNTVRHRLRRIETLTGRSLSDPPGIAELCLALEAVRSRPELLSPTSRDY
jgi:PucR C-terminal helix-turn-helix domain/GGDEF-like domain